MGVMSFTRIATYFGAFLLLAFVVIVLAYGAYGAGSGVVLGIVLVLLIVGGTRLYGRQSRYGAIAARKRPAQEAHNHAADLAADARRSTAEAAKRGERYCPLDPANDPAGQATTNGNGHASAARPARPPRPS
jgi:hypothetical protein